MSERWYKEAVIYCLEVESFQDSDGDGCGDLRGLIERLDYLSRLGVTCLWLNPIHPTPNRDDGYDVSDYYGIEPRLGTLGDFVDLTREASQRGIRILLDLVVNHTSDQHPWFQAARSDPQSPFRDWYVWSDREPADRRSGVVFPGEQRETWTWDGKAEAWYYHRFYDFQPDLNWGNRAVREEIKRVMGFWIQLGASGFRIDAAPFVIEMMGPDGLGAPDYTILDDWRQDLQWRNGEAILLCEANVDPDDLPAFTASGPDAPNDRAHMLFAFPINPFIWLSLARQQAEPLIAALRGSPPLAAMAQWATFLRNHDELDLSRLTSGQRQDVFDAFAPQPGMRLYDRGIRRRLASMVGGDRARVELAYALQFSMPGTPVLRYGEEIGMFEDLALPGRDAIRTPMQWAPGRGAGFSSASPDRLVRPMARSRPGVNVRDQQGDPQSLLTWFERLISTSREVPEIGVGTCTVLDAGIPPTVLVHRFDAPEGASVHLHNLSGEAVTVTVGRQTETGLRPFDVFSDQPYPALRTDLKDVALGPWGYRWIRVASALPM